MNGNGILPVGNAEMTDRIEYRSRLGMALKATEALADVQSVGDHAVWLLASITCHWNPEEPDGRNGHSSVVLPGHLKGRKPA